MSTAESQIGQLCLQIHTARAPDLDITEFKKSSEALAKAAEGIQGIGFSEGEDDGHYLNVVFAAQEPLQAWRQVRAGLLESPTFGAALKPACMAMCTGATGWEDYLLLYHYDASITLDAAGEA